jgi:hypothetical protein
MSIEEACKEALHYSGYECISGITKTKSKYIISVYDKQGYEPFESAVVIDLETGIAYDYSPLDDDEEEYEIIDTPLEYKSTKGIIISTVVKKEKT